MRVADLLLAGPGAQVRALDAGEVTAVALVDAALAAIAGIDPSIGAFVRVDADGARAAAREADEARAAGARSGADRLLLGVPVAVKDDTDIAGQVTGLGSRAFTRPALADAEVVRRLRTAGAVIVGKTALPELGVYGFTESAATGATRNPWDRWRTPGGSSGGSAAAVAAGMVGLATASDGAGSIRIPAACCGLVGFKPSAGTMPSSGSWNGLSVQGVLTRRVEDTARYLDAVGDLSDSLLDAVAREPGRLRIGIDLSPFRVNVPRGLDAQVRDAVLRTGRRLAELGHEVWRVRVPQGAAPQAFTARYLAGINETAARADRPDLFEPRTQQIVRLGAAVRPAVLIRAIDSAPAHGHRALATTGADMLLTPVLAGEPPEIGQWGAGNGVSTVLSMGRFYAYTPLWNHTGQPAVSMPAGFASSGLPLAAQLVARRGDDARLLSLAAQLEAARPFYDCVPTHHVSRHQES